MTATLASAAPSALPTYTSTDTTLTPPELKPVANAKNDAAQTVDNAVNQTVATADTVTLSEKARQSGKEEQKQQVVPEKDPASAQETSVRAVAKTEFVYDQKGELIIKYMDTSDKLVYQIPSELMLKMREEAAKAEATAVNTKA